MFLRSIGLGTLLLHLPPAFGEEGEPELPLRTVTENKQLTPKDDRFAELIKRSPRESGDLNAFGVMHLEGITGRNYPSL